MGETSFLKRDLVIFRGTYDECMDQKTEDMKIYLAWDTQQVFVGNRAGKKIQYGVNSTVFREIENRFLTMVDEVNEQARKYADELIRKLALEEITKTNELIDEKVTEVNNTFDAKVNELATHIDTRKEEIDKHIDAESARLEKYVYDELIKEVTVKLMLDVGPEDAGKFMRVDENGMWTAQHIQLAEDVEEGF